MKRRNFDEFAAKAANDTKPKPRKRLAREHQIADAIDGAEDVRKPLWPETQGKKPRLLVETSSPDETLPVLRDILAGRGLLFDRGVPVRLAFDQLQQGTLAQAMMPHSLVLMAHAVCRPYAIKKGEEVDVRLPYRSRRCISTGAESGTCHR